MSEDLKPSPAALERMARAWCIEHYDGGPPTHGDPVEPFRQALAALAQHDQATPGVEGVLASLDACINDYQPSAMSDFDIEQWAVDAAETMRDARFLLALPASIGGVETGVEVEQRP